MELSFWPLAFHLILTVASRLFHPYSTDDKTSRLMVKQFSTVRETQRGSQSYMEKKRGWERDRDREREEIEVTRRRRGVKNGESTLSSNRFPKCSPPSGTHRDSESWVEKRRGREETEETLWRKRRVQRGREQSSQ